MPGGRRPLPGRHELHFGTREIVIFGAAFVLVWVLTFVFGVLVGRELGSAARVNNGGGGRAPLAQAAPKADRAGLEERLTFYRTLTAPAVEAPPSRPPTVEERLVPAEPVPPRDPRGSPSATERAAGRPPKAASEAATAPASRPPAAGGPTAEPPWTVQVSSFKSRPLAEDLRGRLAARGYEAYLLAATSEGGRVRYRVRVGAFATRVEAERVADELKEDGNLNPFVVARR